MLPQGFACYREPPQPQSREVLHGVQPQRKQVVMLTLPSVDKYGRILQLWTSSSYALFGTVIDGTKSSCIVGSKIINPLNPTELPEALSERLQKFPIKAWGLV
jgi:hypothetical protein